MITNENRRLSKEKIEKMVKDAEDYKHEDQEYKKKVDAFNALEDFIYDMKNKIKNMDYSERLKMMEHKIADATKWIEHHEDASIDEVQAMKEYLESICMQEF
uniref:Uncharacterized protein n=3 Tax=Lactuca sativa TaxID=4236 RepID=A0A9R1VNS1_LACSA|nr:hypothetical protein LSAT_V11C400186840 [Lactuca sativa]KAJ0213338.1 hypothetical protein LSAT_V11C400186860 [Lactuca sativa]